MESWTEAVYAGQETIDPLPPGKNSQKRKTKSHQSTSDPNAYRKELLGMFSRVMKYAARSISDECSLLEIDEHTSSSTSEFLCNQLLKYALESDDCFVSETLSEV
jgi:hypothetical protein